MRILNISLTKTLIDHLKVDSVLRRICKFDSAAHLPCEATFSNVFAEFSEIHLAEKIHENFIVTKLSGELAHNVSRDSTAIPAREKPARKQEKKKKKKARKRGRPKKSEKVEAKPLSILQKQLYQSQDEMLTDLPSVCGKGGKKDSKGNTSYWNGYKLHIDTIENDIPGAAIITSASLHDSNVAIPLESMTYARISSLYSLMDAAYDAKEIKEFIHNLGKIPVIDHNPRRGEKIPFDPQKKQRYKARSGAERVNAYLKDSMGITGLRYRGAVKIMNHLSFGLLAIATEQILKTL